MRVLLLPLPRRTGRCRGVRMGVINVSGLLPSFRDGTLVASVQDGSRVCLPLFALVLDAVVTRGLFSGPGPGEDFART